MSTEEVKALVEALRVCASAGACKTCERDLYCEPTKMLSDAADAIEALQAELEKKRTADCWGCKCEKIEAKRGEIVRCGECKHYNAGFECLIEGYGIERDPDWFCADGEREVQE